VQLSQTAPEPGSRSAPILDGRLLTAVLAVALLLTGAAAAAAIATGAIDLAPAPERISTGEAHTSPVLAASAGGRPVTERLEPRQPTEPTVVSHNTAQSEPQRIDADSSEQDDRLGLFTDVGIVHADGREADMPFGAIYASSESSPENPRAESQDVIARTEEPPAPLVAETQRPDDETAVKWIELPNAINLRSGPSVSAKVIRVMKKGSRLEEIERKRGWVKVSDPETQITGWVYPNAKPSKASSGARPATPQTQTEGKGFLETVGTWLASQ
jgi:uncharacterized protein YgiM (DUF1202 family)